MFRNNCRRKYWLNLFLVMFISNSIPSTTQAQSILDTMHAIHVTDQNWGYDYGKNREWYFNIKGTVYGPYDYVNSNDPMLGNSFALSNNNWALNYSKGGKWYINIKGTEYGPYDYSYTPAVSDNNWGFAYKLNNEGYINIKGTTYGPYTQIYPPIVLDNNWIFAYQQTDNKWYINAKGSVYGPYSSVSSPQITDTQWSFAYSENNLWNVVINTKSYGPYTQAKVPALAGDNWGFGSLEADGWHVNFKEEGPTPGTHLSYGPFSDLSPLWVSSNGGYGFGFRDPTDNKWHANVNNMVSGPYLKMWAAPVSNTNWAIAYQDEGDAFWYVHMKNGTEYGPFYEVAEPFVFDNSWGFLLQKYGGKNYINIDGIEHGPYVDDVMLDMSPNNWGFIVLNALNVVEIKGGVQTLPPVNNNVNTGTGNTTDMIFTDVSANSVYGPAIKYLKDNHYVNGYPDGSFKPYNTINRAEFTKIITGIISNTTSGANCFTDVRNEWFAPYVCYAKDNGIIRGYPDGSFGPSKNINLAEALKLTMVALHIPLSSIVGNNWYDIYVNTANEHNYLNKINSDISHQITRGEMAQLIYNLKK